MAAEKYYNEISYELNKRTVILDRVYGKTTRDLLRAEFKTPAQDVRDSLKYDITVAVKLRAADEAIKKGDLTTAADALKVANDNLSKVTETFKAQLTAKYTEVNAAYEAALTPKVESVSAINAAELVVTFNKAIDKDTVIDPANGTLVDGVFTITRIDTAADFGTTDNLKASLSADGKTLTILSGSGKKFDGKYAFTVAKEAVKTVDKKALPAFSSVVEVKDTTRPVIKGVTYKDAATAVVEFSEPVDLTNLSVTAKRADDVALNGSTVLNETKFSVDTNDPRKVVVDLSAINTADLDKDIVLTLVGISDYNGNLVSPNPTSITVKYNTSDKTKASVTSVARVASDKLQIKFDRALAVKPVVKVGTITVNPANVAIDDNDKSVVNVTLTTADFGATLPTGLQNVEVSGYKGVNLVTGDTVVKVVNFDVENTAPTVVSTKVEKIDGVEYLVVTYNEDVTIPTYATQQITGTKVVNYVTSAITPIVLKMLLQLLLMKHKLHFTVFLHQQLSQNLLKLTYQMFLLLIILLHYQQGL